MYEATAYIIQDSAEEIFLEDVDALEVSNKEIKLVNIVVSPRNHRHHKIL